MTAAARREPQAAGNLSDGSDERRVGNGEHRALRHCYLVRHGRTALNAAGVLRGRLDPPLDAVGVAEVAATAAAIARYDLGPPPRLVRTSPAQRARQTAEALSAATGARVEVDDRLVDRDYGTWAGHAREELVERFGSVSEAPGVEPVGQLRERVRSAFDTAISDGERRGDGAVALVAHEVVNRLLLSLVLPADLASLETIPQRTGCWNLLARLHGEWRLVVLDSQPWPRR